MTTKNFLGIDDLAGMEVRPGTADDGRLSWLCTTDAELQRYLELDPNMDAARRWVVAIILIPAVITAVGFGPALGVTAAVGVLLALVIEWWRRTRPSTPLRGALSVAGFQLILTSGVALSGGLRSPWLPWLAIPVMMLACRFRQAVVIAGLIIAGALAVIACAVAEWADTARDFPAWYYGIAAAALTVSLAIVALTMQSAELKSRSAATRDPLTGLPNRKALADTLRHLAPRTWAANQWLCILVCDLDRFKDINDRYGHPRGDDVLVQTAAALQSSLKGIGTVFRIGGEEFVAVLPGVDREYGTRIAEQLREVISTTPMADLSVTLSVGVAAARGHSDVSALLAEADAALYEAKSAGRNTVRCA
ncbi:MAG TPA: diguanylate cyclase [Micromonospora sp.]